jgi:alpha-D-ribose 1-methylphosphonate 5-triphosphate synthase subunit PhnG
LRDVIEPLAVAQQVKQDTVGAKAAATRVQFFAMRNMRT